jgi:hypothetical protein
VLQLLALLFPTTTTNSTSQRAIRLCLAALTIMSTYQAPFRLLDLPPELLGRVCDYLPDEQLKHIRLVCNALQTHSMTAFGQRFFDHLVVILHPTSLTTLLDIARHEQLSKYVTRVSVSGERIGHSIVPLVDKERHVSLQQGVHESGLDSIILAEALPMLKNLRTMRIDNEQYHYLHWGCNYLGLRCGRKHLPREPLPPIKSAGDDDGYDRVYSLVFSVLEKTNLYDFDLEMSFWSRLEDDTEVVAPFDIQSPL